MEIISLEAIYSIDVIAAMKGARQGAWMEGVGALSFLLRLISGATDNRERGLRPKSEHTSPLTFRQGAPLASPPLGRLLSDLADHASAHFGGTNSMSNLRLQIAVACVF